eukprot:jgi/Bigna1/70348/fgenesh1_pg.11_\
MHSSLSKAVVQEEDYSPDCSAVSIGSSATYISGDCESEWLPIDFGILPSDFSEPILPSSKCDCVYFLSKSGSVLIRRANHGQFGEWKRWAVPKSIRLKTLTDVHSVKDSSVFGISAEGDLIEFNENGKNLRRTWRNHKHPPGNNRLAPFEGLAFVSPFVDETTATREVSIFLLSRGGDLVEFRSGHWIKHGKPSGKAAKLSSPVVGMIAGSALRVFATSTEGHVYEWRMPSFNLEQRRSANRLSNYPMFRSTWIDHKHPRIRRDGDDDADGGAGGGKSRRGRISRAALSINKFGIFAKTAGGELARLNIKSQRLAKLKMTTNVVILCYIHFRVPWIYDAQVTSSETTTFAVVPKEEYWEWVIHALPKEIGGEGTTNLAPQCPDIRENEGIYDMRQETITR